MERLTRLLRRSYALKLAVALVAIIGLVAGLGVVTAQDASEQVRDDARDELTTTARMQAGELEAWLDGVKRAARSTAAHPAVESGDRARIQAHLDRVAESEGLPAAVAAVHYVATDEMRIAASSNERLVGTSTREQGAPFATDPPSFEGPGDTYVTKPFRVDLAQFPVVAVLSPVEGQDAVVVYMINVRERTRSLTQPGEASFTAVVDGEGRFVAHPDGETIGTTHHGGADAPSIQRGIAGESGFEVMSAGGKDDGSGAEMVMGYAPVEGQDWVVMVHRPREEAFALAALVRSNLTGLILMAVVSLAVVGATVGSSTVTSLRQLSDRAEQMAEGDLDVPLESDREDEIGTLYASFRNLRDSLRERITEAEAAREDAERARREAEQLNADLEATAESYAEVMQACAEGDLTRRVKVDTDHDAMAAIGEAFNGMVAETEETVATLKGFAADVLESTDRVLDGTAEARDASREVSDAVREISDGAHTQDETLREVTREMDRLADATDDVTDAVGSVSGTARDAATAGEAGQSAAEAAIERIDTVEAEAERAVAEIDQLNDEMDAIGEIVDVIREIADQTNQLALNASIEAARTGEGSDGFAVVADEVKGLAEETKESAAEIEERIERLQDQTESTTERVRETGETVTDVVGTVQEALSELERIVAEVEAVNDGMDEIDDVTADQAEASRTASARVEDVAAISQQTVEGAETAAETAETQVTDLDAVSDRASALRDRASTLDDLLDEFRVSDGEAPAGAAGGATPNTGHRQPGTGDD